MRESPACQCAVEDAKEQIPKNGWNKYDKQLNDTKNEAIDVNSQIIQIVQGLQDKQ